MARSLWSGSLSFGLVNIPVKLYPAVMQREVRFHMLHDEDLGRIRLRRVCELDDEEVPFEHIVKGYQIERGQYVTTTSEELSGLAPKETRTIDIQDFVEQSEVDPIYLDRSYYLSPDRGANKAYRLLLEALRRSGKAGLARMVLRTKQSLCLVRAMGPAIAVSTLNHADEILPAEEVEGLPDAKTVVNERELAMAEQLVNSLTTPFEPERYRDEYRDLVIDFLERKAEGKQPKATAVERPAKVVSLKDALAASLARLEATGGRVARPKPRAQSRKSA